MKTTSEILNEKQQQLKSLSFCPLGDAGLAGAGESLAWEPALLTIPEPEVMTEDDFQALCLEYEQENAEELSSYEEELLFLSKKSRESNSNSKKETKAGQYEYWADGKDICCGYPVQVKRSSKDGNSSSLRSKLTPEIVKLAIDGWKPTSSSANPTKFRPSCILQGDLRKGSEEKLLFADFDYCPFNMANEEMAWDLLFDYLTERFEGQGFVFRSLSGYKVKVAFRVSKEADAKQFLAARLPEFWNSTVEVKIPDNDRSKNDKTVRKECLDKSESAMNKCSLNLDMLFLFREKICKLPVLGLGREKKEEVQDFIMTTKSIPAPASAPSFKSSGKEWKMYDGSTLPKLRSEAALAVCRFLLGNPFLALSEKGIGLSQHWLAAQVGISQQAISTGISHLLKRGYLKITREAQRHVCPNSYQVTGQLAECARSIYFDRCGKEYDTASAKLEPAKEIVLEGKSFVILRKLTNYFSTEEGYIEFVSEIPGIHLKGRLDRAYQLWDWHIKSAS